MHSPGRVMMNKVCMIGLLLWYVSVCNGMEREEKKSLPRISGSFSAIGASASVLMSAGGGSVTKTRSPRLAASTGRRGRGHVRVATSKGSGGLMQRMLVGVLLDIINGDEPSPSECFAVITHCIKSGHAGFVPLQQAWFDLPANKAILHTLARDEGIRIEKNDKGGWQDQGVGLLMRGSQKNYYISTPSAPDPIPFCMCYIVTQPRSLPWLRSFDKLPGFPQTASVGKNINLVTSGGQWAVSSIKAPEGARPLTVRTESTTSLRAAPPLFYPESASSGTVAASGGDSVLAHASDSVAVRPVEIRAIDSHPLAVPSVPSAVPTEVPIKVIVDADAREVTGAVASDPVSGITPTPGARDGVSSTVAPHSDARDLNVFPRRDDASSAASTPGGSEKNCCVVM